VKRFGILDMLSCIVVDMAISLVSSVTSSPYYEDRKGILIKALCMLLL